MIGFAVTLLSLSRIAWPQPGSPESTSRTPLPVTKAATLPPAPRMTNRLSLTFSMASASSDGFCASIAATGSAGACAVTAIESAPASRSAASVSVLFISTQQSRIKNGLLDAKGEQHVTGTPGEAAVPGVDEQHAPGHDGAGPFQGGPRRLHPVDGFELLVRVIDPDHVSVRGVIGAQSTVDAAGEHRAGNQRGGASLAGVAAAATAAQHWLRRRRPDDLAVRHPDRLQSARRRGLHVAHADVRDGAIARCAPLAAEAAAATEPGLPDNRALVVGIERERDAGLLRQHKAILAVHRDERRRRREVEVGPERLRAGGVRPVVLLRTPAR